MDSIPDIVLGASEIAAALGLSDLQSRGQLWRKKVGQLTEAEAKPNEFRDKIFEHGNEFELRAVEAVEQITKQMFWNTGDDQKSMFFPYEDDCVIRATPDGFGVDSLLEVKCPVGKMYATIPDRYLIQCQVQMSASQRQPDIESLYKVTFAAWQQDGTRYGDVRVWQVLHSHALETQILEHCKTFTDLVRSKTKPPRFSAKKNPKMEIPHDQVIAAEIHPEFRLVA